jgi:hypothetical protein
VRKAVPLFLTVVITMVGTAGIVRASSSQEPLRVGAPVAPSSVFGTNLSLSSCNSSPDNAAEWTRFAKCATSNFTKIQKWAKKLDTCMDLQPVQSRSDAIYGDPADPLDQTNGDALSYGSGGAFKYLIEWKQQPGCPTP